MRCLTVLFLSFIITGCASVITSPEYLSLENKYENLLSKYNLSKQKDLSEKYVLLKNEKKLLNKNKDKLSIVNIELKQNNKDIAKQNKELTASNKNLYSNYATLTNNSAIYYSAHEYLINSDWELAKISDISTNDYKDYVYVSTNSYITGNEWYELGWKVNSFNLKSISYVKSNYLGLEVILNNGSIGQLHSCYECNK